MPSLSQTIHDINQSTYKLDTSGVAGLFGGDYAVDALETIHLYAGRRWAGWYNYPGTVTVAKKFGQMANSRLWDCIFPGPNESPELIFNLAGKSGPDYSGSSSGTKLRTGYLGYLMAEQEEDWERWHINPKYHPMVLWAIIPSLVSILACVFCFLARDPFSASLILLGVLNGGFSSLVIGTATLRIRVPASPAASPPEDGLMFPADGSIIVLKGEAADVHIVTRGEFELDYSTGIRPHPKHHTIGIISLLLVAQFLVQLLLIPFSTFFGQILFLISLVVSGMYHFYIAVASHDKERVHRELLLRELSPRIEKWVLGTRTQMAVFICLVLGDGRKYPLESNPDAGLSHIIPNDTAVWRYWRRKVVKELHHFWKWDSESSFPYVPNIQIEPEDETETNEYSNFTEQDTRLLDDLVSDAWCIFNRYPKWRESGWPERGDGGAVLQDSPA